MAMISKIHPRRRNERKYINVAPGAIFDVESIIDDYNSGVDAEFAVSISDIQEQEDGKCSFKIIGKCVPQYNGSNFRLIARRFTPSSDPDVQNDVSMSRYHDEESDLGIELDRSSDSSVESSYAVFAKFDDPSDKDSFSQAIAKNINSTSCACCNQNRPRTDIYILECLEDSKFPDPKNPDKFTEYKKGDYVQVGSSCLGKFSGVTAFRNLLKDINKKVDVVDNTRKKNISPSSLIEPKKLLACAMTVAKYDIDFKSVDDGSVKVKSVSKRTFDSALSADSINAPTMNLYKNIDSFESSPYKEVFDDYSSNLERLDDFAERGLLNNASSVDFVESSLQGSFGGAYNSQASSALILALDSVYGMTRQSINKDLVSDNVFNNGETIDATRYMACAIVARKHNGARFVSISDFAAKTDELYDSYESDETYHDEIDAMANVLHKRYSKRSSYNDGKSDYRAYRSLESVCDKEIPRTSDIKLLKLLAVDFNAGYDKYSDLLSHTPSLNKLFTDPANYIEPAEPSQIDSRYVHDAENPGKGRRYNFSDYSVAVFSKKVNDVIKEADMMRLRPYELHGVYDYDKFGRKCFYFGAKFGNKVIHNCCIPVKNAGDFYAGKEKIIDMSRYPDNHKLHVYNSLSDSEMSFVDEYTAKDICGAAVAYRSDYGLVKYRTRKEICIPCTPEIDTDVYGRLCYSFDGKSNFRVYDNDDNMLYNRENSLKLKRLSDKLYLCGKPEACVRVFDGKSGRYSTLSDMVNDSHLSLESRDYDTPSMDALPKSLCIPCTPKRDEHGNLYYSFDDKSNIRVYDEANDDRLYGRGHPLKLKQLSDKLYLCGKPECFVRVFDGVSNKRSSLLALATLSHLLSESCNHDVKSMEMYPSRRDNVRIPCEVSRDKDDKEYYSVTHNGVAKCIYSDDAKQAGAHLISVKGTTSYLLGSSFTRVRAGEDVLNFRDFDRTVYVPCIEKKSKQGNIYYPANISESGQNVTISEKTIDDNRNVNVIEVDDQKFLRGNCSSVITVYSKQGTSYEDNHEDYWLCELSGCMSEAKFKSTCSCPIYVRCSEPKTASNGNTYHTVSMSNGNWNIYADRANGIEVVHNNGEWFLKGLPYTNIAIGRKLQNQSPERKDVFLSDLSGSISEAEFESKKSRHMINQLQPRQSSQKLYISCTKGVSKNGFDFYTVRTKDGQPGIVWNINEQGIKEAGDKFLEVHSSAQVNVSFLTATKRGSNKKGWETKRVDVSKLGHISEAEFKSKYNSKSAAKTRPSESVSNSGRGHEFDHVISQQNKPGQQQSEQEDNPDVARWLD